MYFDVSGLYDGSPGARYDRPGVWTVYRVTSRIGVMIGHTVRTVLSYPETAQTRWCQLAGTIRNSTTEVLYM